MKVSLFVTCLVDVFYPEVGKSVVQVLEEHGCEVTFPPGQTCCGQPAFNSGYQSEAAEAAKQMIKSFADSQYVVSPSGSCVSMIRHYYPKLFENDPEWSDPAKELAEKTFEFSDFCVNVLHLTDVGGVFPHTATYHHSCHMSRGLGVRDEPLKLLSEVDSLTVKELPYCEDCCGFGGTFAVKMSDISEAMVDEKVQHVLSTGAEVLIGSDMGCLMNIGGRLRRLGHDVKVMHVAEVLAKGRRK